MPRKGENIYKRKDGRWEGRFIKGRTSQGKALYGYVYAKTYYELKKKMTRAVQEQHEESKRIDADYTAIQLKSVAEEWFRSVQPRIKESTRAKYKNLLNSYVMPSLGEECIHTLSYERLEQFCSQLLLTGGKEGKGLSPKTVSDVFSLIRMILQYSVNKGNIPPCTAKTITVRQQQRETRVLSRSEQKRLCQYLYAHLDNRNMGILICLFTGLRVGEICALKWRDISLQEQTLYVHQTMQRIQSQTDAKKRTKILISTPKSTCSIRKIPLPDELTQVLWRFKSSEDTYILTGSGKYIEPRTMQNHFKKIAEECLIQNASYHALRHTFATRCVELGFDVKSLSEILGHAAVNITMNRYVHPTMDLKRENMKRLSDLFAVK